VRIAECARLTHRLKLRIRALQRDLADAKAGLKGDDQIVALETLLADVSRARDRYQANYLEAHRNELRLQANLEQIRAGTTGDEWVLYLNPSCTD